MVVGDGGGCFYSISNVFLYATALHCDSHNVKHIREPHCCVGMVLDSTPSFCLKNSQNLNASDVLSDVKHKTCWAEQ